MLWNACISNTVFLKCCNNYANSVFFLIIIKKQCTQRLVCKYRLFFFLQSLKISVFNSAKEKRYLFIIVKV